MNAEDDAPTCRDCGTWPCSRHVTPEDEAQYRAATARRETVDEPITLDAAFLADDPNQIDFERLRSYFRRAVTYALPHATGSREGWRAASVEELAEWIAVHLTAGISPTLHEHAVESGVKVARQYLAAERAKNGA